MLNLFLLAQAATAAYNCSQITAENLPTWDLSSLFKSYYNLTIAVVTHETISVDSYDLLFNLCKPVGSAIAPNPLDSCGDGAWACRLLTNHKRGFVNIISAKLYGANEPVVDRASTKDHLIMKMSGGDNNLTITFECAADKVDNPVLEKYIPATMGLPGTPARGGQIYINWKTSAACPLSLGSGAVSGGSTGHSFWTYVFGGLAVYFAAGIAFNYYHSKGKINFNKEFKLPHEKFWIGIKDNCMSLWNSLVARCGGSPSHSQYVEI